MEIIEFQTDWSPSHFLAFWALTKETQQKKIKIRNGKIILKKGIPNTLLIVVVGESNTQVKRMMTNEIFEAAIKEYPYSYNQLIIIEGLSSDVKYPIDHFPQEIINKFRGYMNKNKPTPEEHKLEHYSNFHKKFVPSLYICLKPIWEIMEDSTLSPENHDYNNSVMYLYGGDNMNKVVQKYGLGHVKDKLSCFKEVHWIETEHLFGKKSVYINPNRSSIFEKYREIEESKQRVREGKVMLKILRYLMKNWNIKVCKDCKNYKECETDESDIHKDIHDNVERFIDSSLTSEGCSIIYMKANEKEFVTKKVELSGYKDDRPTFKGNSSSNIIIVDNGRGTKSVKVREARAGHFIKYLESMII